jgi:hypothetical protein
MYNLTWGDVLGYRAGRKKSVDDRDIRALLAREHRVGVQWFSSHAAVE